MGVGTGEQPDRRDFEIPLVLVRRHVEDDLAAELLAGFDRLVRDWILQRGDGFPVGLEGPTLAVPETELARRDGDGSVDLVRHSDRDDDELPIGFRFPDAALDFVGNGSAVCTGVSGVLVSVVGRSLLAPRLPQPDRSAVLTTAMHHRRRVTEVNFG